MNDLNESIHILPKLMDGAQLVIVPLHRMHTTRLLLTFCLLGVLGSFAVAQSVSKRTDGPVTIGAYSLKKGDTLYFGRGSGADGTFAHINVVSLFMHDEQREPLKASYAGKSARIQHFRLQETKAGDSKTLVVINPDAGLFNYAVDLLPAMNAGEIASVNRQKPGTTIGAVVPKPQAASAKASTADELLKLKALLDAGAITKEEYNQQKKKLLKN